MELRMVQCIIKNWKISGGWSRFLVPGWWVHRGRKRGSWNDAAVMLSGHWTSLWGRLWPGPHLTSLPQEVQEPPGPLEIRLGETVCVCVWVSEYRSHLDSLGLCMQDVWGTGGTLAAAWRPHAVHTAGATEAAAVSTCKTHTHARAQTHTHIDPSRQHV